MKNKNLILDLCLLLCCLVFSESCKKEKVPSLTTSNVTNITGTTAISGGTITDEGWGIVTERGICWSRGAIPTINDDRTIEGGGVGTFASNLTSLEGTSVYNVRAYAANSAGIGYGNTVSFKTLGDKPIAITYPPTSISSSGVILNGAVNPDYFQTDIIFEYGLTDFYGNTIPASPLQIEGSTLTRVNATISGLVLQATYHFRIKAVNSYGTTMGKDMTFIPPSTVTDADGNVYQTVMIGTQTWMQENLKTTKYSNGDPVPNVIPINSWRYLSSDAYCWYENAISNKYVYGALYNWYATNDPRSVCPAGWHVPDKDQWLTLVNFLGGDSVAGGKLKEKGTIHWGYPNSGSSNESGFTALPGGFRDYHDWDYSDGFTGLGSGGSWIVSEGSDTVNMYVAYANSSDPRLALGEWQIEPRSKNIGYSIRCIKDQ